LESKLTPEALRELYLPEVDRDLNVFHDLDTISVDFDPAVHGAFLASKEARKLESIPSIGEVTAVTLVAELCLIDRFPNIEKPSSYSGLVPTNHQSGESSDQGHLKRMSNSMLKCLLIEAS
jgi:transposase